MKQSTGFVRSQKGDMHKFSIVHRLDEHSTHLAHQLEETLIQFGYEKDEEHPDGVIVIGGDWTFIHAVRLHRL